MLRRTAAVFRLQDIVLGSSAPWLLDVMRRESSSAPVWQSQSLSLRWCEIIARLLNPIARLGRRSHGDQTRRIKIQDNFSGTEDQYGPLLANLR